MGRSAAAVMQKRPCLALKLQVANFGFVLSETGDVVPRHGFTVWLSVAVWASCFSGVLDDSFPGLQFNLESLPALLASQCPYPPVHSFIVPPRVRAVEYARIRSKCQRELCNVRKTTNKVVYLLPSRDFCLLTFSRAFWISRISFSCFSESFLDCSNSLRLFSNSCSTSFGIRT